MLEEKETKLLLLFKNVEEIMAEFNKQASAAMEDMKQHEIRIASRAAAVEREEVRSPAEEARTKVADDVRRATENMEKKDEKKKPEPPAKLNSAPFQRIIDVTEEEPLENPPPGSAKSARRDAVIALKDEGKTVAQIAQGLGITQNEVKIIIGLTAWE